MSRQQIMAVWELTHDKDFVREVASTLEPEHFPKGAMRWLAYYVKETWEKQRSCLTPNALAAVMEEANFSAYGTTADEVCEIYEEAHDDFSDADDSDVQLRRNVARKWLRQQSVRAQLDAAAEAHEQGDLDEAERALQRVVRASQGPRSELTFENAYIPADKPAIRTGIKQLDKWWRGGAHEGQLATVLAPSNQGKSMILPKFAAEALRVGKNVIYYTTELPEGEVYRRIIGAILQEPLPNIKPDEAGPRALGIIRRRQVDDEEEKAHLSIRYRDPGTVTAADIAADIEEKAEHGIRIHMVVLDGDDIGVAGNKKWEKMYDQYFHIYGQLSALATSKDIVIWTAAQATREAFKKATIKPWHVGDSLWKYRKADLMISMNGTDQMKDKDNETPYVVVSVAKDRYYGSKDRTFELIPLYGKDQVGKVGYEYRETEGDDDE